MKRALVTAILLLFAFVALGQSADSVLMTDSSSAATVQVDEIVPVRYSWHTRRAWIEQRWELNRPYSRIAETGFDIFTSSASALLLDVLVAGCYAISSIKNGGGSDYVWNRMGLIAYVSIAGMVLGGIIALPFAIIALVRTPPQLRLAKNLTLYDSGLGFGLTYRF